MAINMNSGPFQASFKPGVAIEGVIEGSMVSHQCRSRACQRMCITNDCGSRMRPHQCQGTQSMGPTSFLDYQFEPRGRPKFCH